jgi:hypothetical protein
MVARVGIFATISREPRQVRKEATVTVISGAEELPARAATPPNSLKGAPEIAPAFLVVPTSCSAHRGVEMELKMLTYRSVRSAF